MSNSAIEYHASPWKPWSHVVEFDAAISAAGRQVLVLSCAIALMAYRDAWCEARELERAILRAEYIAMAMSVPSDRTDALRRLAEVRGVALHLLAFAPRPSALAIRQIRATDSQADRSAWRREEQEWLVARKSSLGERRATR